MQLNEPVRKSFLDVLQENLKAAQRVTYVHRVIYVAEHSFASNNQNVAEVFEKVIDTVNSKYRDEPLSGILLWYNKYICHVIEGSEDSIFKHLNLLFGKEDLSKFIGKAKLLIVYHHINQRFTSTWGAITGKPPTLLEKIDPQSDIEKTYGNIQYCVQKLYKLGAAYRILFNVGDRSGSNLPSEISDDNASNQQKLFLPTVTSNSTANSIISDNHLKLHGSYLPEFTLLEFLLNSSYVEDLRAYYQSYGHIPDMEVYKETVWPVDCEMIPYNVFDVPTNPVPDLPSHEEKKDVNN